MLLRQASLERFVASTSYSMFRLSLRFRASFVSSLRRQRETLCIRVPGPFIFLLSLYCWWLWLPENNKWSAPFALTQLPSQTYHTSCRIFTDCAYQGTKYQSKVEIHWSRPHEYYLGIHSTIHRPPVQANRTNHIIHAHITCKLHVFYTYNLQASDVLCCTYKLLT